MFFPESLAREISSYIKTLIDRDASVVDEHRKCIYCPDETIAGQKISIPDYFDELTLAKSVQIDNQEKLVIPLRYLNKNIAYLVLEDISHDLKHYTSLIKSFSELLIQQYYENNKPKLDSTDHFIQKLLTGYNPADKEEFENSAKLLGYDLSLKRIGIVLHLKGFWNKCLFDFDQPSFERDEVIKTWKRNIESALNSFFTKNADLIIAYIGNDRFVIFKAVDNEEKARELIKKTYKAIFEPLKTHRIESLSIGYGHAYAGVDGLISAKKEAELSLDLGERMWGENQAYFFADLGVLSVLADGDISKKMKFANDLLSRLDNEELCKTLECFFERNLNLTETAEIMGIHRNTVIYRLNQITKSLNADPRIFEQAMSIKIALIIRGLFA